jgi:hypothetical protein
VTVLVELVRERLDVRGDLGLQRGREHRPRPVPDDLIEQRPARRARPVEIGPAVLLYYLEHGRTFPNQRANAGS